MSFIRLRHLAFTAPGTASARLDFVDGLNIVYGASNTGKSFASDAVLFMLGAASKLPETDEIRTYEAAWLGLTLGEQGDFTLYRATEGGGFKLFPGLIESHPTGKGEELSGKHSSKSADSVSVRILEELGLQDRWLVRNASGEKEQLSFRVLAKYAVVGEEDIMSKRSPVFLSPGYTERTLEQNLFKLLLTGKDDAAIVAVPTDTARAAARVGKLELVNELLMQVDREIGNPIVPRELTERLLSGLDTNGATTTRELLEVQHELDDCAAQRRAAFDRQQELMAQAGELNITLERFAKLQAVYTSDLQRLHSIEEGGDLLAAMLGRTCPVCGAPPEAQKHQDAVKEIEKACTAAAAEARKIEREQTELAEVIRSLESEALDLSNEIALLGGSIEEFDQRAIDLRPSEASLRSSFEDHNLRRAELSKLVGLYQRRDELTKLRADIEAVSTKDDRDPLSVGPDSKALFEFGETVKAVLTEWGFPDADKVQFDAKANDITVGGKARDANGKGVRAVLHAAFNVAVALHCIEKGLPHPGFLLLDTPLLTYREPLKSKYGALSADEKVLKATSLAEKFYRHLASLEGKLQVIVLENADPPAAIEELAHIEVFTGVAGDGRYGLLAPIAR